jgi:putative flavoprotein involved in K+ transport
LQAEQLPSPAARFLCNPLISGNDGGHSIRLRDLGRQGVRLHGHFEGADDGGLVFSDDLPARLALAEAGFGQRMKVMLDAYIAAASIDAPAAEAVPADDWLPADSGARLDLDAEGITSVIWSTGYGLDFGFLDIPVLDQWNYPRHSRGVTEVPGLYTVGLPWLTRHASSTVALVGYNDIPLAARLPTPLSSVRVPLDQIAATAIDLIVNPGAEPHIRRSMPTLIPRQSSGAPKHFAAKAHA